MAETSRDSMAEQYGDDRNLAARQSIYSYARPGGANLFEWALDLAELGGDERVVDVCCGNGTYLAFLQERAHQGPVHGLGDPGEPLTEVVVSCPLRSADDLGYPSATASAIRVSPSPRSSSRARCEATTTSATRQPRHRRSG